MSHPVRRGAVSRSILPRQHMREAADGRRREEHDRQHGHPGDQPRAQPSQREVTRRQERQAGDGGSHGTRDARLDDSIKEVTEPARYSQHAAPAASNTVQHASTGPMDGKARASRQSVSEDVYRRPILG